MIKTNKILNILSILILTSLISCGESRFEQKSPDQNETMNSGKLKIICDESIRSLIDEPFKIYSSKYPNVQLSFEYKTARATMSSLLSGGARVVLISRDYLQDEDSLMNSFKVKKHIRMNYAYDCLTLFVNKKSKLDTLNDKDIKDYFEGKSKVLNNNNFYSKEQNSSEYANINKMILNGKNANSQNKLKLVNSFDELKSRIDKDVNGIGITYLSSIISDTSKYRLLKIGFNDSNGKYVFPHSVHQANILRNLYPYKVTHYIYLLEDRQNLPFWFASYIAKEFKVQKYFLDKGIVPAYAQIKLTEE